MNEFPRVFRTVPGTNQVSVFLKRADVGVSLKVIQKTDFAFAAIFTLDVLCWD